MSGNSILSYQNQVLSLGITQDHSDVNNLISFQPENKSLMFISSFGNTMSIVNGVQREAKNFDWYYKGNGGGLLQNKEIIMFPNYGISPGIEVELLTVHYINSDMKPVYLGYTLGLDISYKGLRKEKSFLKNISHISQTVTHGDLIQKTYPHKIVVNMNIKRNNKIIFSCESLAGTDYMNSNPATMFDYLFRNKEILLPNMLFYTLTGAIMSTDKAGLIIQNGDIIHTELAEKNIILNNVFKTN